MEEILSPAQWQNLFTQLLLFVPKLITSLVIFLLFWLAGVLLQRFVSHIGQRRHLDDDVLNLFTQTTLITALAFGTITALGTLGIDVTALVAGLGLTGFALGFALKDIISNLLSGILILTYHPFRRGDRISVSNFEGIVSQIDLRYTVLEGDNSTILIPNSQLFTNTINVIHPPTEDEAEPVTAQENGVFTFKPMQK
jgi:small-conductance mechanosensitive channel